MVEVVVAYRVVVRKAEENRLFGRHRHRREDNIKLNLQIEEWVHGRDFLVQDREMWRVLVNVVMNHQVP